MIPAHERALKIGWKGIYADLDAKDEALSETDKKGPVGDQLKAMMTPATMARDPAENYKGFCLDRAASEGEPARGQELLQMAQNLDWIPSKPARTVWEALQALWINHMLIRGLPGRISSSRDPDILPLSPVWNR